MVGNVTGGWWLLDAVCCPAKEAGLYPGSGGLVVWTHLLAQWWATFANCGDLDR